MNDLADRRNEEKERRRAEILDAAEAVAAGEGWEDMTMDQVARRARLSRALLYVYFTDKTDLLFGVGERAMSILMQRCTESRGAAHARHRRNSRPSVGPTWHSRRSIRCISACWRVASCARRGCRTRRATKANAPA